ncbi:MAG: hypothetical protein KAI47_15435 [Deltaproteobacteria bacterium]|nr:hypothetical protein [Deltaproteobacteria bacterium]
MEDSIRRDEFTLLRRSKTHTIVNPWEKGPFFGELWPGLWQDDDTCDGLIVDDRRDDGVDF